MPEAELIAGVARGQRRGGRVEVLAPQRGRRREFVAMAEANAAHRAPEPPALARRTASRLVLEELQRALGLPEPPNRIEGYDISNIQGTEHGGLDGGVGERRA